MVGDKVMNKEGGFVKIYRSMLGWEWHDDPITVATWYYCLLRANWESTRWHGEIIKPGQFITSLDHMAKDIGISVQQLRTALKHLKSTSNLTSKSTNKMTLVTIEKWALYQSASEKLTSKSTSNLTNEQQTTNKQLTTDKNNKESKERKEKESIEKVNQGAFTGAWYHEAQTMSESDTAAMMQDSHQQYAEIKEMIMKS